MGIKIDRIIEAVKADIALVNAMQENDPAGNLSFEAAIIYYQTLEKAA